MTDFHAIIRDAKSAHDKWADIQGLGDCWDGLMLTAKAVRDLLYAASERTLTADERFRLQYELETFVDFTDSTNRDLSHLFLPSAEYERQKDIFIQKIAGP